MNRLSEATIISPSHIISYLKKDFNIEISSGTVYPIFKSLEIDGNIIRLPNKTNRLYVLTPKGKQDIEYLKSNLPLAHKLLDKLLG